MTMETDQHRHALAGAIAAPDAGDDDVSFGHGLQRQLRYANQALHVPGGRRRDRQRHFCAPPSMPAEMGDRHRFIAAKDGDRIDVTGLGQHHPPRACACTREGEHGRGRRGRDDAPGRHDLNTSKLLRAVTERIGTTLAGRPIWAAVFFTAEGPR
ncbi:hypothetical protein [Aquamicrobium defluvii]|uniref:hypothetical protein n=1 Tax=Aquamicrobium defluvii TaxID=69279 RepID=UPI001415236B|nr:hypothetical protein [Aquamicrobium defluvii]